MTLLTHPGLKCGQKQFMHEVAEASMRIPSASGLGFRAKQQAGTAQHGIANSVAQLRTVAVKVNACHPGPTRLLRPSTCMQYLNQTLMQSMQDLEELLVLGPSCGYHMRTPQLQCT